MQKEILRKFFAIFFFALGDHDINIPFRLNNFRASFPPKKLSERADLIKYLRANIFHNQIKVRSSQKQIVGLLSVAKPCVSKEARGWRSLWCSRWPSCGLSMVRRFLYACVLHNIASHPGALRGEGSVK